MTLENLFESILAEGQLEDMRDRHAANGLHPDVFNHLYHNALPNNNKSLGDADWLAHRELAGEGVAENHEHVKHIMTEFSKPAIKANLQKKKANQYKSFSELEAAVTPHIGSAVSAKEKSDAGTEVVFQNDTHIVRHHKTQESMEKAASLPLGNPHREECDGKATWCVSASGQSGKDHFANYTENGKHPFYTIEHTANHPTDPHRKYAVLVDPSRNVHEHEFRDERQRWRMDKWDIKDYIDDNPSIMHTEPGKYIDSLVGYHHKLQNFTGTHESFSQYGEKHTDQYVDGIKHGISTIHHADGRLHSVTEYKNGEKNGVRRSFNADGNVAVTEHYVDDVMHGTRTETDNDGNIIGHGNYDEGTKVGTHIKKYPNGNLKSIEEYNSDGDLHGGVKSYYSNGKLALSSNYKNNRKHGTYVFYHDNAKDGEEHGSIRSKGDFDQDSPRGTHIIVYKNGQLQEEKHHDEHGYAQGVSTQWYPSGRIKMEMPYHNDNYHGVYKEYHDVEGSPLKATGEYKNHVSIGTHKNFYQSGNIRSKSHYGGNDNWDIKKREDFKDEDNVRESITSKLLWIDIKL